MIADRFLQQTTANADKIRDIEERIQSLGEVLTYPLSDQDSEEKARREALGRSALSHLSDPSASLDHLAHLQEISWDYHKARTALQTARDPKILPER